MIVSVIKIQRDPDTHRYNTILVRAHIPKILSSPFCDKIWLLLK